MKSGILLPIVLFITICSTFPAFTYGMGAKHQHQSAPYLEQGQGLPNKSDEADLPNLFGDKQEKSFGGTGLDQIVKCEDLSDQYVLGYGLDPDHNILVPFAIYDKTFSTPFYPHFWRLMVLGSLGIGDINLVKLTEIVKKKVHKERSKKNTELLDILTSQKFLLKKPIQVSEDFWKSDVIIWKEGKAPNLAGFHPLRILFSDLDWSAMVQRQPSFAAAIRSYDGAADYLKKHEAVPLNPLANTAVGQFQDLEFRWNEGGFYEVFFPRDNGFYHPVKVIDLRNKYSSLGKAAFFSTLTNIIKGGLVAIPLVALPGLIAANLERVFDLVELLYLLRHAQALDLVLEALDNNGHSPFLTDKLSKKDLEDSVFYLLRANTLLSSVIKNLFKKSDKLASGFIDRINKKRESGIKYLRGKGFELYPIENTYFGVGLKRDEKPGDLEELRIYALGFTKFFRKTPLTAVDLLHPNHESFKRNFLQGVLYGSNFIFIPIPGVISILKLIYKELIIREVHRRQIWESGLLAHIHHVPNELKDLLVKEVGLTEEQAEEYERLTVSIIENERMNPLELDSEECLVHQKNVEDWIRQRDPAYSSWKERGMIKVNDATQSNPSLVPLQCIDLPCASSR
ncbi:MAG: hypothetical protein ABIQ95_03650 [Bdellovibrionia bacterium]